MDIIVHTIRLLPGASPARFERWVREVDYLACRSLASITSFSVAAVSDDPSAPFHYFEVIVTTSRQAFEVDATTSTFRALVADFEQMATVVAEIPGRRIEPGYVRGGGSGDR